MSLLSRAQEIFGKKVFREDVTFKAKLIAQNGMEVYKTPVAGEPSLGTLHFVSATPSDGDLFTSTTANNTFADVTASMVPVGAKAILVGGDASVACGSATHAYCWISLRPKGSSWNANACRLAFARMQNTAGATTLQGSSTAIVALDSSRVFQAGKYGTGGSYSFNLQCLGYFI